MRLKKVPIGGVGGVSTEAYLALGTSAVISVPLEMESKCSTLHPNHRVPYILSRRAASAALSSVVGKPITFVGSRHDAERYGACLSLSHEDFIGGAVAWLKGTPYALSIDVVDVHQVGCVAKRFPRFGSRWMPRCDTNALSFGDMCNIRRAFGRQVDPLAVTLAQHWGLRECCVKLVGVEGRSFPFECYRGPAACFPEQFEAQVVGRGREALRCSGLGSTLFVSTWSELVELSTGGTKPYVVMVAACPQTRVCYLGHRVIKIREGNAPKSAAKATSANKNASAPKPSAVKAAHAPPAAKAPAAKAPAAKAPAAKADAKKGVPKAGAPKPTATAPKAPAAKEAKSRPAAGTYNGVYVKNWGQGSVDDATRIFKAAGNIVSVQIRRRRYALVFFENAASVRKAIDLFNEKEVLGTKVSLMPAKTKPKPDPHEGSSVVFLSPIFRESTTNEQIRGLFAGMRVLRIRTYRQNYAYVYLDSPAAALKFVQAKNGTEFRGKKLRVALSTRSLEKDRERARRATLLSDAHNFKKDPSKEDRKGSRRDEKKDGKKDSKKPDKGDEKKDSKRK